MKSTGEVMGIDDNFLNAYIKSQIASGVNLPNHGKVFLSIDNDNKGKILSLAKKLLNLNFEIIATKGTANFLKDNNILVKIINKVKEGSPHIVDSLLNNEINLVINSKKHRKRS